ncbi:MAG: HigA family addiction module antitoxin, partial [Prosthecobacter sp.]
MSQTFQPDYASPPGETLAETLDAMGLTQSELARRMGRPIKTINEIIQGKAAITADTALELERVLVACVKMCLYVEYEFRFV